MNSVTVLSEGSRLSIRSDERLKLMKTVVSAIVKLIVGVIIIMVLLFVPAGTFNYAGGLLFMAVLFVPMIICGLYLAVRCPALLEKRMRTKETQSGQRTVIILSALMFIAGFISAGLSFRYDFLMLPLWVSVCAGAVFLAGYILYFVVLCQNEYLSRIIEVSEGQKVIDTGMYSVVRHPMYLATVMMFTLIGLILASFVSAIIFFTYPFIIAARIKHEEIFLEKELDGYSEYIQKVKYRLIPKIY